LAELRGAHGRVIGGCKVLQENEVLKLSESKEGILKLIRFTGLSSPDCLRYRDIRDLAYKLAEHGMIKTMLSLATFHPKGEVGHTWNYVCVALPRAVHAAVENHDSSQLEALKNALHLLTLFELNLIHCGLSPDTKYVKRAYGSWTAKRRNELVATVRSEIDKKILELESPAESNFLKGPGRRKFNFKTASKDEIRARYNLKRLMV